MRISPEVRMRRSGSGQEAVIETGSDQVFIEPQGGDGTVRAGPFPGWS